MDGLVAAIAAGQQADTYEASITTVADDFFSLWTAGGHPGAGAIPASGSGVAPTNATAGALPYVNPSGSNTGYLARCEISATEPESIILIDRLVHTAGLSGNVNTAQTVDSAAITRAYSAGAFGQLWVEVYTALGATASAANTVSYTNQSGLAGQSGSFAIPASAKIGFVVPVTLASGDYGVESVQSVTLGTATGTVGSFGVTLTQRIATIPVVVAGAGVVSDFAALGLPIIQPGACLSWYVLCSTTSTGTIYTELAFVQG